ncbi:hypothetical protein NC998_24160 [Trichocoleus desertorum GB2-A4]|uniref:EF-hand domain-containing protein n=1 Tax=Trichocoleus desertorum GB2-A4 TaxID=2933944 RepID=A0ABV0JEJ0_9CYAN|nr:hypothetical protein [Trichocoleus sp. FACHB-46]MBD1862398.1 hypothetical protein [Trichocoleus sp. FACHB-46]
MSLWFSLPYFGQDRQFGGTGNGILWQCLNQPHYKRLQRCFSEFDLDCDRSVG